MSWWGWAVVAAVLAGAELVFSGWVLLGFAVGAALMAVHVATGWPTFFADSLPLSLVVFAVLSLIAWLVLRAALGVREGQVKRFEHDIND